MDYKGCDIFGGNERIFIELFTYSWFIFIVSAYLLYWIIIMPTLVIIPFLISSIFGLLCFYFSRKLDDIRKK